MDINATESIRLSSVVLGCQLLVQIVRQYSEGCSFRTKTIVTQDSSSLTRSTSEELSGRVDNIDAVLLCCVFCSRQSEVVGGRESDDTAADYDSLVHASRLFRMVRGEEI